MTCVVLYWIIVTQLILIKVKLTCENILISPFTPVLGDRYSRAEPWTKREVMYVGYIGELFLRALKALIIPLIVSSLVSAIGESASLAAASCVGLLA